MPTLRVATFNCENLFARYKFRSAPPLPEDGFSINDLAFEIQSTRSKRITARAIKDIDADVICLQEVENQPLLDRFNSEFLGASQTKRYRHRVLLDGNDLRHIDVAILSRYPIVSVRSHRHDRNPANTAQLFSRDCLQVTLDAGGAPLTLYANHFKSMIGGRKETQPRRKDQAEGMAAILTRDFGAERAGDFVVLGDLNDYPQRGAGTTTALDALLDDDTLVNVIERLPRDERWTHYYAGENEYRQLDYLLVSKQLDQASGTPLPLRELRGLPWRADAVDIDRYEDVGVNDPKASDHVPIAVDVQIGAAEV